jgi:hypothetical protein
LSLRRKGPAAAGWLIRHAGRRGAFLFFLAILDVCYGYALLSKSVAALNSQPDFFLSLHSWGWAWLALAAVCATGVLMRRDIAQYTAAAFLKAAWGALYADAWLIQHYAQDWISAVVWLSFGLTVLLIAGWPERP